MQLKLRGGILSILGAACIALVSACGGGADGGSTATGSAGEVPTASVRLDPAVRSLAVGETGTFRAEALDADVNRLKRQRDALGAVNLRAEEDAREVQVEHDTLVTEKADLEEAIKKLRAGVDIVVACPGRLLDVIDRGACDLRDVSFAVVDEADRMADDGFTPQVEWILRKVTGPHQTMLFSATLDGDVAHLVARYMKDPVEVAIDAATDTVGTMHHLFLAVHHMDKDRVVASIASGMLKTIVFCQTKRTCDRVEEKLLELGVKAAAIHGDLAQAARERALKRFTDGQLAVLVATDVAARGIDVDDIGAVIHYEPAGDVKDYLHRSGRTARAGRDGWAVTLAEYNQHTQVRILQRGMRLDPNPPTEVFSNDVRLKNLPDKAMRECLLFGIREYYDDPNAMFHIDALHHLFTNQAGTS